MRKITESPDAMATKCVDTSARLREFLYNGHELAWDVRRDIATIAIQLLDLSAKLEQDRTGGDNAAWASAEPRQGTTPKVA